MPRKIYIVDLTEEERSYLLALIKSGEHSARKLTRAQRLLNQRSRDNQEALA